MRRWAGWIGIALHVGVAVVPYGVSGLVAPAWAYVLLYALWAALLAVAVRLVRADAGRRAAWALLVPAAAVAVWVAVISLGAAALDWTA